MPPRRTKQELIEEVVEDEIVDEEEDDDEDEDEDESESGAMFEPSEVLRECHWQRRTIGDLVDMMATPFLELNPDYQRDVVWSGDRMTKLINSLISNFYVPPVIFNVQKTASENGTERYKRTSVDGKQRLSSIREFVGGNIPCTDKNGRKWYFANNGESPRKSKRILNDKTKRRFMQMEILCAEYSDLERKQEEDLFSRVQLGVPLTPAEKLRASSGAWQAFAIDIEKQYPDLMLTVDNKRGRSFQLVLHIFKQILHSDEHNPKYSAGAVALKGFCDRPKLLDESFKATARRVFNTYNEVLKKHPETFDNHAYSHATKYSPIEFVGTAVLINQYPQRSNPSLLSGDILKMRTFLRENRQDLRSNTKTWKYVTDYIDNLEGHRGGVNVIPQGKFRGAPDMSMVDAGEGGSSQFLPLSAHRPPTQLEMQPVATRTKGAATTRAASASTGLLLAPGPTPPATTLPPKPDAMNVRTGHLRLQPPREPPPPPPPPAAPAAQRQPPTAPLAQRQPPTAPASQRQPQRQPPLNPQLRAPVAPLGQAPMRNVADRFRAVNTSRDSNATPLFNGGTGSWTGGDNEVGSKRGSVDGGYSGRNEHSSRDGNYSGGQRSNKRNRTDYDHIKRERGSHFE